MLPIVPPSRLELSGSYKHNIPVKKDGKGRLSYMSVKWQNAFECKLDIYANGYLHKGIQYEIGFHECLGNTITKIKMKSMIVVFGPFYENGPTLQKEIGETLFDHRHHKEIFSLTKEETLSLLPRKGQVRFIPVEVHWNLKDHQGNRLARYPEYNFYDTNRDSTLAVLFKDNKIIYANLALLSSHSVYFKTLSENLSTLPKDTKSGLPLLKLKQFESEVFHGVLELIYPGSPFFHPTLFQWNLRVPQTLRLAYYLSMEIILVRYEEWLVEDEENSAQKYGSPIEKLLWSEEYGMSSLQHQTICGLCTIEDLQKIRANRKFNKLSKEVVEQLLDRVLKIDERDRKYRKGTGDKDSEAPECKQIQWIDLEQSDVDRLDTIADVEKLRSDPVFFTLSKELLVFLFEKTLEISEKRGTDEEKTDSSSMTESEENEEGSDA